MPGGYRGTVDDRGGTRPHGTNCGVPTKGVASGLLLTLSSAIALVGVVAVFLAQPAGQRIDETALRGARIGQSRVLDSALSLLHLVSGVGLVLATVGIAVLACLRRRVDLAIGSTAVVGGSNITTQLLKHVVVERPNLGIETYTVNSLPSGHTTVAVSLAVALLLVAPPRLRGMSAVGGAVAATVMGVAALAAGWHRPSDVVAATFVVGVWAGAVCAVLALTQRARLAPTVRANPAVTTLAAIGPALLAVAALALWRTSRLDSIPTDRSDLLIAYAGGAAGIGGIVSLLLALVIVVAGPVLAAGGRVVTASDSSVRANGAGVYAAGTSTRTQATRPGA